MKRRDFLASGLAAGSLGALSAPSRVRGDAGEDAALPLPAAVLGGFVDTNTSLGAWPFRRLPLQKAGALEAKLGSLGVVEAWASSFEGLLHRDLRGVNERLAETCATRAESTASQGGPAFVPVGVLNPLDPAWEGDLARCLEDHEMRAVRLYPAWHGYGLDAPALSAFLDAASASGVLVQVSVLLEDVRTQHPVARVGEVDLSPLPDLLDARPEARVQLLNARLRGDLLARLAAVPSLLFDTARTESTSGVRDLAAAVGAERVLFGSHAPFLIPEAALVRVGEAAFEPEVEESVLGVNARSLSLRSAPES